MYYNNNNRGKEMNSFDYGQNPFVVDINKATLHNGNFRTTLWTGKHLQLTLMSIPVGQDIGLEVHPNVDQFLRLEDGQGVVVMGDSKDHLYFKQPVYEDSAVFIPAGTWHNVVKLGFLKSPIATKTVI